MSSLRVCADVLKYVKTYKACLNKGETKRRLSEAFLNPVDPNLAGYGRKVPEPMALLTIENKLRRNKYASPAEFARDVRLIFSNALRFNASPGDTYMRTVSVKLAEYFESKFVELGGAHWEGIPERIQCQKILDHLISLGDDHDHFAFCFLYSFEVYYPEGQAPKDYRKVVKTPMDLGTVTERLRLGTYRHVDEFARDVRLTFNNCKTYWTEGGEAYLKNASVLLSTFEELLAKLVAPDPASGGHSSKSSRRKSISKSGSSGSSGSSSSSKSKSGSKSSSSASRSPVQEQQQQPPPPPPSQPKQQPKQQQQQFGGKVPRFGGKAPRGITPPPDAAPAAVPAVVGTLPLPSGPVAPSKRFPWKVQCLHLLDLLQAHTLNPTGKCPVQTAGPFLKSVDTILYPDYLDFVKEPICLADIAKRVNSERYGGGGDADAGLRKFEEDVKMMCDNALAYNSGPLGKEVCYMATTLKDYFLEQLALVKAAGPTVKRPTPRPSPSPSPTPTPSARAPTARSAPRQPSKSSSSSSSSSSISSSSSSAFSAKSKKRPRSKEEPAGGGGGGEKC